MQHEFANRQNMHLAVFALLADPVHQPLWKNQSTLVFTTRQRPHPDGRSAWAHVYDERSPRMPSKVPELTACCARFRI